MRATATDVKNRFGEFLDRAQKEPITIEKNGRPVAMLISMEEHEILEKAEDFVWGIRACEAEKSGYIGHEATMKFINDRFAEIDREERGA